MGTNLWNRVMYVELPAPQWSVLQCFHCIPGCSNVIIGYHNKTTMLAGCVKSADISILLHIPVMKLQ